MPVSDKKKAYGQKLVSLIKSMNSVIVVEADNVGSKQMQDIRAALRGEAEILMGKNTTIRRVMTDFLKEEPDHPIKALYEHIQGNIGFVFTNGDISKVRDVIEENKVPAPARVGALAPIDVFVPPGPTGCDPGQTAWFQALQIPTKINRGQIEITAQVKVIQKGTKVGDSEAALLQKLNIRPFAYGLATTLVYDNGEIFEAKVLDLSEADVIGKFLGGARMIAAIGMMVGYPTQASVMHSINNAYKAVLAVGLLSDFKFPQADSFQDFFDNPGNFAAPAAGGGGAAAAAVEEEEEEEEEESVSGGGGGLFGDESSS